MAQHAVTREQVEESIEALHRANGVKTEAARLLGLSHSTYRNRLNNARLYQLEIPVYTNTCEARPAQFEVAPLPSPDLDIADLLEHRKKQFGKKQRYEDARKLIQVKVKIDGPVGVYHFGDPHIDDDGTDIAALEADTELVRITPGCFGANVGDTTNNWIGRLARLWEQQSTSGTQAWMLAEWFLGRVDWLYIIGGNHDCHDQQTEALTKRGWLHYSDIRDDDEVLSFVDKTGECLWTPILKRIVRQHDGEIIDIETRSINLSVTPNHRILCRPRTNHQWKEWQYINADDLPSRIALPTSGVVDNIGVDLTDDQLSLAGWVLTDGSIEWTGNSPRVRLYQSKDGGEITRLLNVLNLDHTYRKRHRAINVVAGRKLVHEPLPQQEWTLSANASRKVLTWVPEKGRLPGWANWLSASQFHVLLRSLIAGDGCWDGKDPSREKVAILHGTEEFLSSVQAIAVQHGWNARISMMRDKDFRLNLCRRETIQFETKPAIHRRNYSGEVWCLTVPHGNFMVRRNGAAHFSGNCWSGTGDPIKWIQRGKSAPYMSSEVRLELKFPNGNTCRINARHDFSGHSQYNPAHGPMKANMFGVRDHIAVAGHRHVSGHGVLKNPDDGSLCHSFLVAGYKVYDRFAMEKGFRDQRISPGVFTIIDPSLPNTHPDFVTHYWTIERGVQILNAMRKGL